MSVPATLASPPPTSTRLRTLLAAMGQGLLERDTALRLALLAALAGEHLLLIGPPGTAKSALARRLHHALADAPYFERLLTRFSTPEELFGPLSLKALEDDRYERLVAGFLPTAGVAFLDEVFKANSAILNALLTLLNEREFDNGTHRFKAPLISLVGASNEGPTDEALLAFFDRFLLRVWLGPVADGSFDQLLQLGAAAPWPAQLQPVSAAERQALAMAAAQVRLGPAALAACRQLRAWLAGQQQAVSDRRWRQWVQLMRVAAASEGRDEVDALDLWLAPHVAGGQATEAERLAAWFVDELMQAAPQDAPWLDRAVQAFERQLDLEQSHRDDADADNAAGKLALARAIGLGAEPGDTAGAAAPGDNGMLRLASVQLEAHLRRRYSTAHIAARVAQVDEVLAQAQTGLAQVQAQLATLAQALAPRLWLPPALAAQLQAGPAHTQAVLAAQVRRLQLLRQGFAALPVDEQAAGSAPPAVVLEAPGD